MRDPELEAAYLATDYWVESPEGAFAIRIGEICIDLAELLLEQIAVEWAFVTACNPQSVRLSNEENHGRMMQLEEQVRATGWRFYHGRGEGRNQNWPPESSVLILDISIADAVELARQFGQNAIVAGRIAEPARLVWIK